MGQTQCDVPDLPSPWPTLSFSHPLLLASAQTRDPEEREDEDDITWLMRRTAQHSVITKIREDGTLSGFGDIAAILKEKRKAHHESRVGGQDEPDKDANPKGRE